MGVGSTPSAASSCLAWPKGQLNAPYGYLNGHLAENAFLLPEGDLRDQARAALTSVWSLKNAPRWSRRPDLTGRLPSRSFCPSASAMEPSRLAGGRCRLRACPERPLARRGQAGVDLLALSMP